MGSPAGKWCRPRCKRLYEATTWFSVLRNKWVPEKSGFKQSFFFFHLYRWNHLQFTSGAQCSLFSEIWLWFQLWGKTASWLKRNFSVWSIFCIQTWFYWDLKVSALRVLPSAGVQCSGLKAVPSFSENKNKTPAIRRTISVTQVHALCNMKVHNLYWSFI